MSVEYPSTHVQQLLLVFATVFHSIAVVLTSLRLWVRVRLRRVWWEDAWAALALCLAVISAVSTWMLNLPERTYPQYMSHESHIVMVWLTLLSYTCLTWAVRMSIVFSSIRMVPPASRMRTIANGFAVAFFFLWALCVASEGYTCGSDRSWYNSPNLKCPIGFPIAMIEFTTNVIADVALVALPIGILWRMRLSRNERVIIFIILSTSLLTAMVNIVHVGFLIPVPGYTARMTADIEGALDLGICNLLVLVISAYRWNGEDIEIMENDFTSKSPEPSSSSQTTIDTLTTVDLESFETMSIRSAQSAPIPQLKTTPTRHLPQRSSFDGTGLVSGAYLDV
ncbi:hypothetical protein V8E55_010043 [Tylopilus felleus]